MKTMKKTLSIFLAILMVLTLVGCKKNEQPSQILNQNYQEKIDSFVPDGNNSFELTVGESHKPAAAEWLKSGEGSVFSDNENVVTVTPYGKVTAVGEGVAHIVISPADNSTFEVFRYDVYGPIPVADLSKLSEIVSGINLSVEIENFDSNPLNTYELKVGETHSAPASVWASNGRCYSTDDSVVTVAENGVVTAVGKGTAYVVIEPNFGNMHAIYMYLVKGH